MNVVLFPDSGLKRVSDRVDVFDEGLRSIVDLMTETMYESNGVGLAAPQVRLNSRIVVIDPSAGERSDELMCFINPTIVWSSDEAARGLEGCLSIPNKVVDVYRSVSVEIEHQDVLGHTHRVSLSGLPARIAQHELDHLDGVLMIDRVVSVKHRMTHEKQSKTRHGKQNDNCR